jgi:hypothetical protein
MTWTLKIVHLDVAGNGDATLIIAKNEDTSGNVVSRSVLIDGGKMGYYLPAVMKKELGKLPLDVMICTHYDDDHLGGLAYLLKTANKSKKAEEVEETEERATKKAKTETAKKKENDGDVSSWLKNTVVIDQGVIDSRGLQLLSDYRMAVAGRMRPTAFVNRMGEDLQVLKRKQIDLLLLTSLSRIERQNRVDAINWLDANFLVGEEIMWSSDLVGQSNRPNSPKGAPNLTCVAANGYVIQKEHSAQENAQSQYLPGSMFKSGSNSAPNDSSLAFLLTFGNFRYYVGGDLTSVQESGEKWDDKEGGVGGYVPYQNEDGELAPPLSLMHYLGNVDAMKTSHHGARESSSPTFINSLKPRVAFISCSSNNKYGHPHQEVVNTLEGCGELKHYFLTGFYTPGFAFKTNKKNTEKYTIPELGGKAVIAGAWRKREEDKQEEDKQEEDKQEEDKQEEDKQEEDKQEEDKQEEDKQEVNKQEADPGCENAEAGDVTLFVDQGQAAKARAEFEVSYHRCPLLIPSGAEGKEEEVNPPQFPETDEKMEVEEMAAVTGQDLTHVGILGDGQQPEAASVSFT